MFVLFIIILLVTSFGQVKSVAYIMYSIAECFAFLVCTKWSNPMIHRNSQRREASSSSTTNRYLDWNSGLVVSQEDQSEDRMCGLQDIGGHIMKIPFLGFQILLCMRLEVYLKFISHYSHWNLKQDNKLAGMCYQQRYYWFWVSGNPGWC